MKKKLLELFAGSRSVGKEAEKLGFEVYSVDKFINENMSCICDIQELTKDFITDNFGTPDIIWGSPVCSAWSKVGWHNHRKRDDMDVNMLKLAINDGFESIDDFFNYFNEDTTGKIIHWTDLEY